MGKKIRSKVSGYMSEHNITSSAVPIAKRSFTIPVNNNKTINAKRNHLPVVSACAITIHKSQEASFDEIVYEYEKTHSQQLVYGRRESTSVTDLQNEFKRLSLNRLQTVMS